MKNKTKRIELNIGHHLLCAFINGDESGIEPCDIEAIDNALETYGPYFHVYMPDQDEPSFSRCDISGLMDDCYLCQVEVSHE